MKRLLFGIIITLFVLTDLFSLNHTVSLRFQVGNEYGVYIYKYGEGLNERALPESVELSTLNSYIGLADFYAYINGETTFTITLDFAEMMTNDTSFLPYTLWYLDAIGDNVSEYYRVHPNESVEVLLTEDYVSRNKFLIKQLFAMLSENDLEEAAAGTYSDTIRIEIGVL